MRTGFTHCCVTAIAPAHVGATSLWPTGWEEISYWGQDGWTIQEFLILSQDNREVSTELENILRGHRFSFQLMCRIKLNISILSPTFPTAGGKPNSKPESTDAGNNISSNLCCIVAASQRVYEFWVMIQTLTFNGGCTEFLDMPNAGS